MRDTVFVYIVNGLIKQATLSGAEADRFELGLGDRMLGKVILEAR